MSGTTDVVVWYDGGACTVFDAPAMSLADGFVHEDNNIDWSDPDDGIYWERSCVYMLDADGRGPAEASPRVVDPETGEVIAEFDTQAHAEEYAEYLSAQGRKAVPSDSAGDEPPSASCPRGRGPRQDRPHPLRGRRDRLRPHGRHRPGRRLRARRRLTSRCRDHRGRRR